MSKDRDYVRMIHTVRWLRLRKEKLMSEPMCEECKRRNRITSATEVHHIKPVESAASISGKEDLMFNIGNLMSLCHECHRNIHVQMKSKSKAVQVRRQHEMVEDFMRKFSKQ